MALIVKCDRCKEVIAEGSIQSYSGLVLKKGTNQLIHNRAQSDLCNSCAMKVVGFMHGFELVGEDPPHTAETFDYEPIEPSDPSTVA